MGQKRQGSGKKQGQGSKKKQSQGSENKQSQGSEKKQGGMFNNSLRMVGGLYLVYMAYRMYTSILAGEQGGVPYPVAIGVAVIFLLSGAGIFWISLKADLAERKQAKKAQEERDHANEV